MRNRPIITGWLFPLDDAEEVTRCVRSPVLDLGGRIAERQVKGREAVGFLGEGAFHSSGLGM